jgi:hypothetical protein
VEKSLRLLLAIVTTLTLGLGLWMANGVGHDAAAAAGDAERCATLPAGAPGHPEGMTFGNGRLYVASFELPPASGSEAARVSRFFPPPRVDPAQATFTGNNIYTINPANCQVEVTTPLPSGAVPLGNVVVGNNFYVIEVLSGSVLKYNLPLTSTSTPVQTFKLCGGFAVAFGAPGVFCALNGMDAVYVQGTTIQPIRPNVTVPAGAKVYLFMADNGAADAGQFTGHIYRLDVSTGQSDIFYSNPALDIPAAGFPPFGVVDIRFTPDGSAAFLPNFSTDSVWKLTVNVQNGAVVPGALSIFASGAPIDGPNHGTFDAQGRYWVTSGENSRVLAFDAQGRVVANVAGFLGIDPDGGLRSLGQPATPVFVPAGVLSGFPQGAIFADNECNPSLLPPNSPLNCSQVTLFTVARIDPAQAVPTPTATPIVPEISPLWLFGSGLIGLSWLLARSRRRG